MVTGFIVGLATGVVITGFVFVMWGHKNTEKITKARDAVNDKIEETFD